MKKIKQLALLLIICLSFGSSFSQEKNKNTIFSLSPQYVFRNGLRFDIEHKLTNKNSWIGLAPTIYYSNSGDFFDNFYQYDYYYDDYDTNFDTIVGFGLDFYHKLFLVKNEIPKGFYFTYGLNFNFFNMYYHTYDWEITIEDNLEYINYTPAFKNHTIKKFGANLLVGYQFELSTDLFLDIYTGVGMRMTFQSDEVFNTERFNSSSIDYGYSGPLMLLGFKIGVKLNREQND